MQLLNVEIIKMGELKTFANDFKVLEFVVKTDEVDYPQFVTLKTIKDTAENVLKYNKVGDRVDVSINIEGRAWENPEGETKYFNSILAWKVFKADASDAPPNYVKPSEYSIEPFEDNSLPF